MGAAPASGADGETLMLRFACVLVLATACLAPANDATSQAAAPSRDDLARLAGEAESAAWGCDLQLAASRYAEAEALCAECTPTERVALERARVHVALLKGEPRQPTLAAAARVADELQGTDRLAAAQLFAELGRWQAPELLERAAQSLRHPELDARRTAGEALRVVLIDPEIVARGGAAREWSERYQLFHYYWRAPGSPELSDRYSPGACRGDSEPRRVTNIPGAGAVIHGQRIAYEQCYARALDSSLPGQRVDGVARMGLMVDGAGTVTRLDVHGAFIPEQLVNCIGEIVKAKQFGDVSQPGLEEVAFRFAF